MSNGLYARFSSVPTAEFTPPPEDNDLNKLDIVEDSLKRDLNTTTHLLDGLKKTREEGSVKYPRTPLT